MDWVIILALTVLFVLIVGIVYCIIRKFSITGAENTDILTGIGNIKYLNTCFDTRIDDARKYYCLSYIAFDAEHAERTYGKEKIDDLQKFTAKILSSNAEDYDYAARVGNGIFALLFRYPDINKAKERMNALLKLLEDQQGTVVRGVSVVFRMGLYQIKESDTSFETVFNKSKIAYTFADETKIPVCFATEELIRTEASRNRLRQKLSRAIDAKEFDMFFQFIYNIKEQKFTSAEILSRWNNPEEGFLLPGHYINDMRNTGVISKFDYYMLDKTCKLLADLKKEKSDHITFSCNVTRITISEEDFLEKFRAIVKKYDFDHDKLMLEITEDALIDDQDIAFRNISDCKTAGFHIAIDDFGTGNSSFADLCDYPIDIIKLDRAIIVKATSEKGGKIISNLTKLAHELNIEVLCEGVETEEQNNAVIEGGSDYIQGYFHSYVFPLSEAKEYYKKSLEK